MNLDEPITLTITNDQTVTLPLVNFLRLTVVYLRQLKMEYLEQEKNPTLAGFDVWLVNRLGMKGKNVLL